jgi:hypothetical protein
MLIVGLYLTLVLVLIIVLALLILFIVVTIHSPFQTSEKISNSTTDVTFGTNDSKINVRDLDVIKPIPILKQQTQNEIEKLLQKVIGWLNEAEIENWAVRSTMLAAVRHSSLMSWHENITVAVDHKHLSKLVGIRAHVQKDKTVLLIRTKDGYRFAANNFSRFPFVNIFIATIVDEDVVCCTPLTELGHCTFKDSHLRRKEIYNVNDVFPLRQEHLGNVDINVPHNAEKCLDILYGSTWNTQIENKDFIPFYFNSFTKNILSRLTFS